MGIKKAAFPTKPNVREAAFIITYLLIFLYPYFFPLVLPLKLNHTFSAFSKNTFQTLSYFIIPLQIKWMSKIIGYGKAN
jgi:hypothetical protein